MTKTTLELKHPVAEEEARVAAAAKAAAEDRRLKKEKAIRNGTYRTKKQIEEAIKHVARLDVMKAAGIVIEGFDEQRAAAVVAAAFGSGGGESDDEGME